MKKYKYRVAQNGFYKIESWKGEIVIHLQAHVSGKGMTTKLGIICKNRSFKFHAWPHRVATGLLMTITIIRFTDDRR